jgi:hypothetical protein
VFERGSNWELGIGNGEWGMGNKNNKSLFSTLVFMSFARTSLKFHNSNRIAIIDKIRFSKKTCPRGV